MTISLQQFFRYQTDIKFCLVLQALTIDWKVCCVIWEFDFSTNTILLFLRVMRDDPSQHCFTQLTIAPRHIMIIAVLIISYAQWTRRHCSLTSQVLHEAFRANTDIHYILEKQWKSWNCLWLHNAREAAHCMLRCNYLSHLHRPCAC